MRLSAAERGTLLLWGLCSSLLMPFVLLRYWLKGLRETGYRQRLDERLGRVKRAVGETVGDEQAGRIIWVHAVSLGEVRAATPLVEAMLAEKMSPVLFSCSTPTGSFAIRQRFADRVMHCYMPWDAPGAVKRFLRTVQPRLLVLTEAELWPVLLDRCRRQGIPVVLANARISARSTRRYLRFAALSGPIFKMLRAALARTDEDAKRLISLGTAAVGVKTVGDLKYSVGDARQLKAQARSLGKDLQLGYRECIWLAGSTHQGEEQQVLQAAKAVLKQLPQALLILAPRHPRRFDEVAELAQQMGLSCQRRSQGESARQGQVFLLDSIGELSACYGLAQVAFIGGSLVAVGGHNLLEPAMQRCPVLTGPHLENFAEIAARLRDSGGLQIVDNVQSMTKAVTELLRSPDKARRMGEKARQGIAIKGREDSNGSQSLQHHLQAIKSVLDRS